MVASEKQIHPEKGHDGGGSNDMNRAVAARLPSRKCWPVSPRLPEGRGLLPEAGERPAAGLHQDPREAHLLGARGRWVQVPHCASLWKGRVPSPQIGPGGEKETGSL